MAEKIKTLVSNKKAYHDYHIHEKVEAGMVLLGTEIKSLRAAKAHLKESYAMIKNEEIFLFNCHISPYDKAAQFNHDPMRPRKLLLRKKEIIRFLGRIQRKGYSLVPLKIYLKGGRAKIELGFCTSKKEFDKRETIKKREAELTMAKAMKGGV